MGQQQVPVLRRSATDDWRGVRQGGHAGCCQQTFVCCCALPPVPAATRREQRSNGCGLEQGGGAAASGGGGAIGRHSKTFSKKDDAEERALSTRSGVTITEEK